MIDPSPFPLIWPEGQPRRARHWRTAAPFRMAMAPARDHLLNQLRLMHASSVVISSNAVLLKNGLPAARQPYTDDPGVAVYFVRKGKRLCIPCDQWSTIEDNVRAIGKSIEAIRGLERWGGSTFVESAFAGLTALPEHASGDAWWRILGVAPHASVSEIERAYRAKLKETHPDTGGTRESLWRVQTAYETAISARGVA